MFEIGDKVKQKDSEKIGIIRYIGKLDIFSDERLFGNNNSIWSEWNRSSKEKKDLTYVLSNEVILVYRKVIKPFGIVNFMKDGKIRESSYPINDTITDMKSSIPKFGSML